MHGSFLIFLATFLAVPITSYGFNFSNNFIEYAQKNNQDTNCFTFIVKLIFKKIKQNRYAVIFLSKNKKSNQNFYF